MNPWLTIWTKVRQTVTAVKDTTWVNWFGKIPFILWGFNYAFQGGGDLVYFLGLEPLPSLIIVFCFGILVGLLGGQIWTYLLLWFGKIWRGLAKKKEIETVLSLSLIPEVIKTIYLIGMVIAAEGDFFNLQVNPVLVIICWVFTLRIMIIGLSTVQKFSYGVSILNLVVPQLVVVIVYLIILA